MAAAFPRPPASAPGRRTARFWRAGLIGLFEHAGFYTFLSFAVVYLGRLGFGGYAPSLLVGVASGVLAYALQVPGGALADRVGPVRTLRAGSSLLLLGYATVSAPLWLLGSPLPRDLPATFTAAPATVGLVAVGLLLVGCGRALVSPSTASLVHAEAGEARDLAFGLYFTLTYAGVGASLGLCWRLRSGSGLMPVFALAAAMAGATLAATLGLPPAPRRPAPPEARTPAPPGWLRFGLATAGFFALAEQLYLLMPAYLARLVEPAPALDLVAAVIPLVAVLGQAPVAAATQRWAPATAIAWGARILGLGMLANVPPLFLADGPRAVWLGLPAGTLAALATLACGSLGSLLVVPRVYGYLGAVAPPGREGRTLGLAAWIMALGHLAGAVLAPLLLQGFLARHPRPGPGGLPVPSPWPAACGWTLCALLGWAVAAVLARLPRPGAGPRMTG